MNEAVKNNPEKFPAGYVLELTSGDVERLRSKFSTLNIHGRGQHTKYLSRCLNDLSAVEDNGSRKEIIQRSGDIISDIINENCIVSDTETTFEVNLAMRKFKHTIKRKNK